MMKWRPYLLLPLGIIIGYVMPKPPNGTPPRTDAASHPPRRNRTEAPADTVRSARILALADRINNRERNSGDSVSSTVDIRDIPAILERLLS